ncbi:MAG: EAL domain-containing protein [Gammaproteobacteria bacterium]|nr:EAL domain-containing protein [Gammaproteobacteria bacterium]
MVAGDDAVLRSMLRKLLEQKNCVVIEAVNGADAIEQFATNKLDMVFLDAGMSSKIGIDDCAEIRSLDPERIVPVLLLIADDDMQSIASGKNAGATDFFTKPIDWNLFEERIDYLLATIAAKKHYRKQQEYTQSFLANARPGEWRWILSNDQLELDRQALDLLGSQQQEINNINSLLALFPESDRQRLWQVFNQAKNKAQNFDIQQKLFHPSTQQSYVRILGKVTVDESGKPQIIKGIIQDITSIRRDEDMILHQAYYDSLTDLPNLLLLKEHLAHALKLAEQTNSQVAVVLLGIDRFQIINASLGHEKANQLWIEFAGFLRQCLHQGDTLARISENDFVILMEGVKDIDQVQHYLQNIRESLMSVPLRLSGEQLHVSLSMGVAIFPEDNITSDDLLKSANAAMRKARSRGGDQECFYSRDISQRLHNRLQLERELRDALLQEQLEVLYQPQQSLQTGKIIGAESLLRWNHPEYGVISPSRFIPLAEETGLISTIGAYVINKSIHQAQLWHDQGHSLRLGINLSARQFSQPDLVDQIQTALETYTIPSSNIDFEITESIAMRDANASIGQMHQLKKLGVHLAMDDFGTGYSSLSYLHQFPLDVIKIDQSFVKDIKDKQNGAIAKAIIAMAHSLGLEVIAEGVETQLQLDFLKQNGCQYIQGYLVSKPLTADEFEVFINQ